MALPSTGLSLNDIYEESTPGYNHPNPLSFTGVSYPNWTEGNAGSGGASQTLDYNPYSMDGQPISPLGADVLYGFPILDASVPDPVSFAEYQNNQYFFDGTTFDIQFAWSNPLTNSFFPPPPTINDVNVTVKCYDYNMVYKVHNDFSINAPASTSGGPSSIPGGVTTSPLVENVYWEIDVSVGTPNSITNIAFQVNGTTRYNTGVISGLNNFTWQSAGASAGVTNSSGIVYNIVVS